MGDNRAVPPEAEREERAKRIAAMLDRWEEEDVSAEPDWDPAALEPLDLRPADSKE
jgi:hypothetical protein